MTVRIVIDNRVRLSASPELTADVVSELRSLFTHKNPKYGALKAMGKPAWNVPKKIETWGLEGESHTFPRGAFAQVREVLSRNGVDWTVEDERTEGERHAFSYYCPLGPPAEYQERAVDALVERENCLLMSATGSRKTSVGMMLIARLGVATLVLVDTVGLMNQWLDRVVTELGVPREEIGRAGGGDWDLRPVTVGMPQTITARIRKPEYAQALASYFGMVMVDEVHGAAASRLYQAVDFFPARYRFGLSADYRRKDRLEFLIEQLFGEVGYEVDREDLVQMGAIMDVEIKVVPTDFEAPWYGLEGEQPPSDLVSEDEPVEKELNFLRLLDEMHADPRRQQLLIDLIAGEVGRGSQLLVLAHRRDHCRAIDAAMVARRIPSGFLIGGADYAKQFAETKAGLLRGEVKVGVGTIKSIGQAIDIPRVGVGVVATPLAGNRQKFNQARGRFCRIAKGKEKAVMYYLWDRRIYDDHLRNIVRWNPTVSVLSSTGEWLEGNEYLRRHKEGGGYP